MCHRPYTSWEYLNKLCYEGLDERYGDRAEELKPRLKYELDTIQKMGYVDYFLIVWDFIRYARDHGIPVGPGGARRRQYRFLYARHYTAGSDPVQSAL